jgi:hypothetical protein
VGATTPRACNSLIALSMIGRGLGFESIPAQDMALLSMSATASQASAASDRPAPAGGVLAGAT